MSTDMSTAEVIRIALMDLQVCVPKDATDEEATDFVNTTNPTGISSRWAMKKEGNPTLVGYPERVNCEDRADHVHIVFEC